MPEEPSQKEVVLARAGLLLAFFVFILASITAFQSGARPAVIVVLAIVAVFCLWAALFESKKVVVLLGRWLP